MTLDEVKKYFKTTKNFMKVTGLTHTCFFNWEQRGYIPFKSQFLIQELTKGVLKADLKAGSNTYDNRRQK